MTTLQEINKLIEETDDISKIKYLAKQKLNLINKIRMKVREQYPENKEDKIKRIREDIADLKTVIKEQGYLDEKELKELIRILDDLKLKLFTLTLEND